MEIKKTLGIAMSHDLTINDLVVLPSLAPKSISIGRITALKQDIGNGQLFAVVRTPIDENTPNNEYIMPLCELNPMPNIVFLSGDINALKPQNNDRRFMSIPPGIIEHKKESGISIRDLKALAGISKEVVQ